MKPEPVINIKSEPVIWDAIHRIFSCEASDLQDQEQVLSAAHRKLPIAMYNPETCRVAVLRYQRRDVDPSGEDVYGWHYRGTGVDGRSFEALIIND